ncbi:uncharacterized protein SCHCODRAFT_01292418 [Schizophyllum commune H4-8]|uniref:uncharacterized protein n=1 Tax=Schizophyllum commune (strain H4-8 / FGSC 9210) TaxID=578458 RepID=UPI00215EE523|nr:uncharacterized protein SCHCODRAFT_01292418 [Schizophyllum commune H4-8]KAI5896545.1 hypothetical protein SCHCODRAFT_01292418 [Schizophyllum commune H4-8]
MIFQQPRGGGWPRVRTVLLRAVSRNKLSVLSLSASSSSFRGSEAIVFVASSDQSCALFRHEVERGRKPARVGRTAEPSPQSLRYGRISVHFRCRCE